MTSWLKGIALAGTFSSCPTPSKTAGHNSTDAWTHKALKFMIDNKYTITTIRHRSIESRVYRRVARTPSMPRGCSQGSCHTEPRRSPTLEESERPTYWLRCDQLSTVSGSMRSHLLSSRSCCQNCAPPHRVISPSHMSPVSDTPATQQYLSNISNGCMRPCLPEGIRRCKYHAFV